MYQEKESSYAVIAIVYYIVSVIAFFIMGVMSKNNNQWYHLIYVILFLIPGVIVWRKDKNVQNLGLTKTNLSKNLWIAFAIVVISFMIGMSISDYSMIGLVQYAIYYLFYIGFVEELVYRGFVQNYLFGLPYERKTIFAIGGIFFSFMHIPFQMYVHNMEFLPYLLSQIQSLVVIFLLHLIMCYITYKRDDIIIPVALHFSIDFLAHI